MALSPFGLFRRGRDAACLPSGLRIYAIGDIHGCLTRLEALHRAILQDARGSDGRRLLIYLGDYVDRGEDSRGVIELLLQPPPADEAGAFERVFLKGNHEDFMLQALEDKSVLVPWLTNGGDQTCRAYGIEPTAPPEGTHDLLGWLREALAAALPPAHLAFLRALQLHHAEGGYYFCHAGVDPAVALEQQAEQDLLWMREPFLSSRQPFGKVVVHGHTPTSAPERRANRIGIDTGACYGGRLTALVLDGHEQRFLQA